MVRRWDNCVGEYYQSYNFLGKEGGEYRNGKKGVLGLFMGEVMRRSQGKADPKRTNQLIREKLEQ